MIIGWIPAVLAVVGCIAIIACFAGMAFRIWVEAYDEWAMLRRRWNKD